MTDNYGIIRVTLLSQDVYGDYVIRKLEVSAERENSSAVRNYIFNKQYNTALKYIVKLIIAYSSSTLKHVG